MADAVELRAGRQAFVPPILRSVSPPGMGLADIHDGVGHAL